MSTHQGDSVWVSISFLFSLDVLSWISVIIIMMIIDSVLTFLTAHSCCLHNLNKQTFPIESRDAHGLAGGGVRGGGL